MSHTAVIFNSSLNSFTLYWAILASKRYEVLAYGQDVLTLADVEALHPVLLVIDHVTGLNSLELDNLHTLLARSALASLPILVITSAIDISTTYPFLQTVPNVTLLVQPFDYRTFLARVEQALQKCGARGDTLAG
jgi:FixJ family two-component response regulator